jgi:DNA-3-methyladenine glycosylase II
MQRNVIPPYASDAIAHLKRVDPILGDVIDRVGLYAITRRPERFHSLVRAIIFQQLAGRAAQTIFDRFVKAVGGKRFPTPALLLAASDEVLRGAGLSRGKMSYIRDLATHVNNRTLDFHRHSRMTDDEIIADLTRVRGIGRWTAEMFLMFNLHRPDVLPVDDLGVRNAVGRLYKISPAPTAKALREFGERWRPYRSVASWYLWQSYNIITPDGGVPAPDGAAKKATAKPPTPKSIPRKIVAAKASAGKTNARKPISIKAAAAKITHAAPAKSVTPRKTRATIKKS